MNKKLWFIVLTISILGVVSLFISISSISENQLQYLLNRYVPPTLIGAITLFTILALATAFGLPRQIAAFCAGYSFNISVGFIIATAATITGCIITFIIARYCLHNFLKQKYANRLIKVQAFLSEDLFTKALIIRLIPAGSNFLTNLLAGSANIAAKPYFLGSLVGYLPQMLVFTLAGYGIKLGNNTHLLISGLLFLIALLLGINLYKRHKKRA